MRKGLAFAATTVLLLAACGGDDQAGEPANAVNGAAPAVSDPSAPPSADDGTVAAPGWDLQSSGEGVALVLGATNGKTAVRLFCPAGADELLVNVPAFHPVGSEERLSFGSGGEVVALVADTHGDAQRGGVSGTGSVPDNLAALVAGPIAVNYGAQNSGPHPAPPANLARAFAGACGEAPAEPPPAAPPAKAPPAASANPCMIQGSERLNVSPRRAIGTEPFWGARIEGRCVTYSHPEDQDGTRVWTRYARGPQGETWTGALGGQPFVLRIRPQPGCSDGMSDNVYPQAAELTVQGEERKGCARPM